jgi:hypothetical protein
VVAHDCLQPGDQGRSHITDTEGVLCSQPFNKLRDRVARMTMLRSSAKLLPSIRVVTEPLTKLCARGDVFHPVIDGSISLRRPCAGRIIASGDCIVAEAAPHTERYTSLATFERCVMRAASVLLR